MIEQTTISNSRSLDHSGEQSGPVGGYNEFAKRLLDLGFFLAVLPFVLPIVAVLYVTVRLDGGPGFFGHERVGRDGKVFRCWKLRTMVPDAEARLNALLASDPEAKKQWEDDRKLQEDPRITRFGNFLRKTSLDELPQIWNVLMGDMSVVGPRPVTEPELEKYGVFVVVYLAMRPGITGVWQVSGRNDVGYSERVQIDVSYYRRCSFFRDIGIILKTVGVVFARTGR